jgi:hypothetical protein
MNIANISNQWIHPPIKRDASFLHRQKSAKRNVRGNITNYNPESRPYISSDLIEGLRKYQMSDDGGKTINPQHKRAVRERIERAIMEKIIIRVLKGMASKPTDKGDKEAFHDRRQGNKYKS